MKQGAERLRIAIETAGTVLAHASAERPTSVTTITVELKFDASKRHAASCLRRALVETLRLGVVMLAGGRPELDPWASELPSLEQVPRDESDGVSQQRLERELARRLGVALEVLVVDPDKVELNLSYCSPEGLGLSEYLVGRLAYLSGDTMPLRLTTNARAFARIALECVEDGKPGCDRWALATGLLQYAARRKCVWHVGADALPSLRRGGVVGGKRVIRAIAIGPEGILQQPGARPPGYLIANPSTPMQLCQIEFAIKHDSVSVFVDCGDPCAAAKSLALTARSLSLAACSDRDPGAVLGSMLLERFALRVTPFGGGRFAHIDFRPNRVAGAARLLHALTRNPNGDRNAG